MQGSLSRSSELVSWLVDYLAGLPRSASVFVVLLLAMLLLAILCYIWWPLCWYQRELKKLSQWLSPAKRDESPPVRGKVRDMWACYYDEWKRTSVTFAGESRGTVPVEEGFSIVRLQGRTSPIPGALPGIFTGLGILGTFVGIVIGLYDLQTRNADALMGSVEQLLAGMSTAFVSSIVGIACSLLWVWRYELRVSKVDSELKGLWPKLAAVFPTWDELGLLRAQLKLAEEQKGTLQSLGTDIAAALETAMTRTVTPALENLTNWFMKTMEESRTRQTEGLGELAEKFHERLMASIGTHFDRLSSALAQAAQVQEEAATRMEDLLREVERLGAAQRELLDSTTQATERFEGSVKGLTTVHEAVSTTALSMREVAEAASRLLADTSLQVECLMTANVDLRRELATQLDSVQAQVSSMTSFWSQLSATLEALGVELNESILEFQSLASERLRDVFEQFDREMARVVEHLNGTLAELREVSQDVPTRIEQLQTALAKMVEEVSALVREFDLTRKAMNEHGESIREAGRGVERLMLALAPGKSGVAPGRVVGSTERGGDRDGP